MRYAIPLLLLLAGCITAQERAQQVRANLDALDDAQCRSFGAVPGTEIYVNCRSRLAAGRMAAPGPVTCTRVGLTTSCN